MPSGLSGLSEPHSDCSGLTQHGAHSAWQCMAWRAAALSSQPSAALTRYVSSVAGEYDPREPPVCSLWALAAWPPALSTGPRPQQTTAGRKPTPYLETNDV